MRKTLAVLLTTVFVGSAAVPAAANNDTAWFLGGVVGGLVLGEALDGPGPYRPRGYYVYEEPVYEKQCYARWVKRWDDYRQRWIKVRKTRCEWVRVY